jgi:hypothetical protein
MATITTALQSVQGYGNPGRKPYLVENEIDFADHAVDPSAGDVVQALTIPAGTAILSAGIHVTDALGVTGGTDAVATLGTDVDPDEYVTGFDADGASTGDYAPMAAAATVEVHGSENTLDVTFSATNVSSVDSGKFRVWAMLMDIDPVGFNQEANEVVRDQLA